MEGGREKGRGRKGEGGREGRRRVREGRVSQGQGRRREKEVRIER